MSMHGATKARAHYFVFPHCCLSADFLPFESQGGCCSLTIISTFQEEKKQKER